MAAAAIQRSTYRVQRAPPPTCCKRSHTRVSTLTATVQPQRTRSGYSCGIAAVVFGFGSGSCVSDVCADKTVRSVTKVALSSIAQRNDCAQVWFSAPHPVDPTCRRPARTAGTFWLTAEMSGYARPLSAVRPRGPASRPSRDHRSARRVQSTVGGTVWRMHGSCGASRVACGALHVASLIMQVADCLFAL
jgi:hypothetical protein